MAAAKLPKNTTNVSPNSRRWPDLLAATLECWVHQLLFVRRVYPRSSFAAHRFLGIMAHHCGHPDVVSYISDTVSLATPALVNGVATEFTLIITDEDPESGIVHDLEKYHLRATEFIAQTDNDVDSCKTEFTERAMRDLLLRAQSLSSERAHTSDTVSFQLQFHVAAQDATCHELNIAFRDGAVRSLESNDVKNSERCVVPLHRAASPLGKLHFVSEKGNSPFSRAKRDSLKSAPPL